MCALHDPGPVDGHIEPPLLIDDDQVLSGLHSGPVRVLGGHLTLDGTLHGTLTVGRAASATIRGTHRGSIHLEPGAHATIIGASEGRSTLLDGATLVVERGGRLAGPLCNDGHVVVHGRFHGSCSGSGELHLEAPGSAEGSMPAEDVFYYE